MLSSLQHIELLLNLIDLLGPRCKCMITLSSLVNKLEGRMSNHAAAGSLGASSDYRELFMWPEAEGT